MSQVSAGLLMGAAGLLGSLVCVRGLTAAGALLLRADVRAAWLTFAASGIFLLGAVVSPLSSLVAARTGVTDAMHIFTVVAMIHLALSIAGWLCLVSALVILGRRVVAQDAPER